MKKKTIYKTYQEIFNKVWQHFIVEKNPQSVLMHDMTCQYYSPEGGCAIGCLISNNQTKKFLDRYDEGSIRDIRNEYPSIINRYINPDIETDFLCKLQSIHDNGFYNFEKQMRGLAKQYSLKVPSI